MNRKLQPPFGTASGVFCVFYQTLLVKGQLKPKPSIHPFVYVQTDPHGSELWFVTEEIRLPRTTSLKRFSGPRKH